MKQLTVLLVVCMMATSVLADEDDETLVSKEIESNGFGGMVLKLTEVNRQTAFVGGWRGGWIINHTYVIGGGVYALINNIRPTVIRSEKDLLLDMEYGGFEFEYVVNSPELIHFSIYTLIGAGKVKYRERDRPGADVYGSDRFFVAEPAVSFMLNVTNYFRMGVGSSYRYINGVNLEGTSNSRLRGLSANLTLKFGKF
jgi:hypothetical protein